MIEWCIFDLLLACREQGVANLGRVARVGASSGDESNAGGSREILLKSDVNKANDTGTVSVVK